MIVAATMAVSASSVTFALLSATAQSPGATLTAGTSGLLVDGGSSTDLGTWTISPQTSQARAVRIANTGDVDLTLSMTASATQNALAESIEVRLTRVGSSASCTVGLAGTVSALLGTPMPAGDLARGATSWLCLELIVPADTQASASGQTIDFTLTLHGDQKRAAT